MPKNIVQIKYIDYYPYPPASREISHRELCLAYLVSSSFNLRLVGGE